MIKRLILLPAFLILASIAANAEMMSVNTTEANVRKGPGANQPVVWRIWKYSPVNVIQKKGAWYFIRDFEGYEGWISKSLLSNAKTVTVKSKGANVRNAASGKAPVVWEVEKEYSFKIVQVKGGWVQVTDDLKTTGWISKSLLWGFI